MTLTKKASSSTNENDRYVAFVDILGFSDSVRKIRDRSDPEAEKVGAALERIQSVISDAAQSEQAGLRYSVFSDSIFISVPRENPVSLQFILTVCQAIAFELVCLGFMTRGAIVRGFCIHTERVVYGEAILRAYFLESQIAKYPRIILGRNVRDDIEAESQKVDVGAMLQKSKDGPYFVNYFWRITHVIERFLKEKDNSWNQSEEFNLALSIRNYIEKSLYQSQDNPKVFEKYAWFADHYNRQVASYRERLGELWPEDIMPELS